MRACRRGKSNACGTRSAEGTSSRGTACGTCEELCSNTLVELAHGSAGRVSMREELDRPRTPPTGGARGFFWGPCSGHGGGPRSSSTGGPRPTCPGGLRPKIRARQGVRALATVGVRAPVPLGVRVVFTGEF